jgi:hypothetical protein
MPLLASSLLTSTPFRARAPPLSLPRMPCIRFSAPVNRLSFMGGGSSTPLVRGVLGRLSYVVSQGSTQGIRKTMEDAHKVTTLPTHPQTAYFAVFDGHGGIRAAQLAAEHVHVLVDQALNKPAPPPTAVGAPGTGPPASAGASAAAAALPPLAPAVSASPPLSTPSGPPSHLATPTPSPLIVSATPPASASVAAGGLLLPSAVDGDTKTSAYTVSGPSALGPPPTAAPPALLGPLMAAAATLPQPSPTPSSTSVSVHPALAGTSAVLWCCFALLCVCCGARGVP